MPFVKYKYKHLSKGLKCALDFVQQTIEKFLQGLDNLEVYLNDIDIFAKTWVDLLHLHDKVMRPMASLLAPSNKNRLSKKPIGLDIGEHQLA